jgi:hypothetical protein
LVEAIGRAVRVMGFDRVVTRQVEIAREDADVTVSHQALQGAQIRAGS